MNDGELNTDGAKRGGVMVELLAQRFGVVALKFLARKAADLRPAAPHCVSIDTKLREAIARLRGLKIGCLLVVDGDGRLLGILSERDCILKVYGLGVDIETAVVGDYMTSAPMTGTPGMSIAHALNLMSHGGFRHIPLVDGENRAIGVISVKDVVDGITREILSAMPAG